jgi:YidC/Oxa1 family membrane protein insertase
MIALAPWQSLLDAIGWVLAQIYDLIPNYGLSIIILTIVIRLLLLPLGIKQIKSMQHMQAIQPKLKELQKKHKGNKQKIQEEQMRLYKEAGVNPLGGCLPLLLQFPILIAMYSVLRAPVPNADYNPDAPAGSPESVEYVNNHLPTDSQLYADLTQHNQSGEMFGFMNLQCSLLQAGSQVEVPNRAGEPSGEIIDCGDARFPDVIPYVVLLLLMIGSTFYQQQQMQKASPPGSQTSQQQAIMRVMPLMFAFFGLSFPAGLVLYWTTSNIFQIGQQYALLRAGHIGPDALEKRIEEQRARAAARGGEPEKEGFMQRLMAKAESAQEQRDVQTGKKPPPRKKPASGGSRSAGSKPTGQKPTSQKPTNKKPPGKGPAPGNQLGKPTDEDQR